MVNSMHRMYQEMGQLILILQMSLVRFKVRTDWGHRIVGVASSHLTSERHWGDWVFPLAPSYPWPLVNIINDGSINSWLLSIHRIYIIHPIISVWYFLWPQPSCPRHLVDNEVHGLIMFPDGLPPAPVKLVDELHHNYNYCTVFQASHSSYGTWENNPLTTSQLVLRFSVNVNSPFLPRLITTGQATHRKLSVSRHWTFHCLHSM